MSPFFEKVRQVGKIIWSCRTYNGVSTTIQEYFYAYNNLVPSNIGEGL